MAVRLRQYCGDCEPCAQGCCCQGMFSVEVTYGDCVPLPEVPGDHIPNLCYWIRALKVFWEAPSACLERLADSHGGLKQYEIHLQECGEVADRVIDDPEILASGELQVLREEIFGDAQSEVCANSLEGYLICIKVIGQDDAEITRCYLCPVGEDEARECEASSSSSSSASSESSASSSSESSSSSASSESSVSSESSSSSSSSSPSSSSSSSSSSGDVPPEPPGSSSSSSEGSQ